MATLQPTLSGYHVNIVRPFFSNLSSTNPYTVVRYTINVILIRAPPAFTIILYSKEVQFSLPCLDD